MKRQNVFAVHQTAAVILVSVLLKLMIRYQKITMEQQRKRIRRKEIQNKIWIKYVTI